jgi:N6-adenosine-specific RNA methylase IME4
MHELFNIINANETEKTILVGDNTFVIPSDCRFILCSLDALNQSLVNLGKFNLVVIDPPWPNKSVARSSQYEQMDIYDLLEINVPQCLDANGCVAVWISNKEKHYRFVREKLFKKWGLTHVYEWIWLKVTQNGHAVFDIERSVV